ncbi:MAG: YtxH domain-containing protein [Carnobacterium sp.]|nr:YtxH domain-containing protein [Carnobacterium sp.]
MSKNNFMGTLFFGTAAAVTALLFAPKSGKELRNDIKEESLSRKNQVMDKVNELVDEVKVAYREVEEEIYDENPELADTIEGFENDLDETAIRLKPMAIQDEIHPDESTMEELPPHNDLKIDDRRGQI